MRKLLAVMAMCLCCAFLSAAQGRLVTVKALNQKVSAVLEILEQKSGCSFFYNNTMIDKNRIVSVDVKQVDVVDVLNMIFEGTGTAASVIDGNIVLSKVEKPSQPVNVKQAKASDVHTVSGTVIDKDGIGVIGASVIPGGNTGAAVITDIDGRFSVDAKKGDEVVISALGFTPETIQAIGNTSNIIVTLKDDVQMLDEVVVVGYGVQKRSDITGAIASVDAEKAKDVPTTSVAEMLRGSAPGIQVTIGSAAPGGSSSILIRGRHSLSGDNAPLYIVDGVPMSSIDDVNANDIASIEVLKDASSQSIYGARAANGVILVTTKRGSEGKSKVSYNGYVGVQTITRNFEFYNGEEWAAYRHEAFYNAYGYYDESDCFRGYMKEALHAGESIDWESVMIKPAIQHKHDILVQAGNKKTKVAFGLGYYDQAGMVEGSSFKKLSGRLNLDQEITKWLKLGANITYARSWKQTADGSFNSFVTVPPLARIYDEKGQIVEDVTEAGESHVNPLWNIRNSDNRTVQNRLMVNLFADVKLAKWVTYRLNTSMSLRDVDSGSYIGLKHTTGKNTQGKATVSKSTSGDYLLENIFNFNWDINGKHHIDATAMQSLNYITWSKQGNTGTGFANDDLSYNAIGNAVEYGQLDYEVSERKIVSFLGRARYNYADRYLFSAAVRVDGSSVFGKNNKYGVFPSAAFAWRINNESFMEGASNWLNNLKLRVSWGQVGNQGISPYTTLGLTSSSYYRFGDEVAGGYLPTTTLYNPDLKWETSTTINLGLDFGFLKDRINGTVEVYDTRTTDLLISRSINQVLGYTSQLVNLGCVENKGIEVALNTTPVSTRDFNWDLDFSFAKNVNSIRKIDGRVDENGNPVNDVNNAWFIGQPVNVYYDYKFDGIWQLEDDIVNSAMPDAKPGFVKVADTNNDGKIDQEDRVVMSKDPDWIGNIFTKFSFKGFDLSADLNISYGGTLKNPYLTDFNNGGDMTGKRNGLRRNYWTMYNPSNEAPQPNMNQAPAYIGALGYQDASYIRLRDVTFGYTFPSNIISKIHLQQLRLYVSCTNVWYYTKVLGYGPEQTPGAYPEPRTALFGVKITF